MDLKQVAYGLYIAKEIIGFSLFAIVMIFLFVDIIKTLMR